MPDVFRPAPLNVHLAPPLPDQVEDVAEEISHLMIDDHQSDEESVIRKTYPDRPDAPDCLYYMRTGSCGYGDNCRYNHPPRSSQDVELKDLPERAGQPDCGYYLKTGTCKYGFTCKYHHPKDRTSNGPASFNAQEKPCPHFMRYGHCKFGSTCRFHHPPQRTQNPSFSYPYYSGLPSWAFTRTPYVNDPRMQNPTNSFPFVVLPMSNAYTTTESDGFLPQRPDQPECRYFINNGTCKYGADCKYHHPKPRIPNFIGPHGLPSRPGELICASYNANGFCKYGSTCRFDHPFLGYSYGYVPHYASDWGFLPRDGTGVARNVLIAGGESPEPVDSTDSGRLVNLSPAAA